MLRLIDDAVDGRLAWAGRVARGFLARVVNPAAASLLSLATVRTRRVITATTPDSHPPVAPAPAAHRHAGTACGLQQPAKLTAIAASSGQAQG